MRATVQWLDSRPGCKYGTIREETSLFRCPWVSSRRHPDVIDLDATETPLIRVLICVLIQTTRGSSEPALQRIFVAFTHQCSIPPHMLGECWKPVGERLLHPSGQVVAEVLSQDRNDLRDVIVRRGVRVYPRQRQFPICSCSHHRPHSQPLRSQLLDAYWRFGCKSSLEISLQAC